MRSPWFALESCDETFFETAPLRYVEPLDLPAAVEQVWWSLTDDGPLAWCRALTSVSWSSSRPFGVGSTRTAKVAFGALTLHERFFRWEEGRRHSFFAFEANLPLYRRFAEDYLIEETSPSSCRFTWSIVAEMRPWARLGASSMTPFVNGLMRDTRRHFGAR
jgi:Polyketide cyclase / dehydrase and lipid transport